MAFFEWDLPLQRSRPLWLNQLGVIKGINRLLGIRDEGPANFPQWSLAMRQWLCWNYLITPFQFSMSCFAGRQTCDQGWRPGLAGIVDEGMAGIKAGICLALKPGLLTKAWIALKDEGHVTAAMLNVSWR
jgi:hypothetical protein